MMCRSEGSHATASAGVDDVAAESESVEDGGAEAWVGEGLVQPAKDSLEAIATEFFSSRSVWTWNSRSAPLSRRIVGKWLRTKD